MPLDTGIPLSPGALVGHHPTSVPLPVISATGGASLHPTSPLPALPNAPLPAIPTAGASISPYQSYQDNVEPLYEDINQVRFGPGSRTVSLRRTPEYGFGFTLRHFIVYPPEFTELIDDSSSIINNNDVRAELLQHSESSQPSSLHPLDTIFVRHVRKASPAHKAGLTTGDRVVNVNGVETKLSSYQEVVAIIQHSPPILQLTVVPKEHDLLQQIFGDTAHNPESNLDVMQPSPNYPLLGQPIPGHIKAAHRVSPSNNNRSSQWSSQSSIVSRSSPAGNTYASLHPSPLADPHLTQSVQQQAAIYHGASPRFQTGIHGNNCENSPFAPNPPSRQMMHQQTGSQSTSTPHPQHNPNQPVPPARTKPRGTSTVLISGTSNRQPSSVRQAKSRSGHAVGIRKPARASSEREVLNDSGKYSGGIVMDRKQSVFSIPSNAPNTSTQSTTDDQCNTLENLHSSSEPTTGLSSLVDQESHCTLDSSGVYEPVVSRRGRKGSMRDSRRLEKDPDGRIYEVVQTRVVESKLGVDNSTRARIPDHNDAVTNRKYSLDIQPNEVRKKSLSPAQVNLPIGMFNVTTDNTSKSHLYDNSYNVNGEDLNHSWSDKTTYCNIENLNDQNKSTKDAIERIKKNVEKKEEFLKRPNEPLWLPGAKSPVVLREYHVNPQKFQRPLWPPPASQVPPSPGAITKALSFVLGHKADARHLRRVKSENEYPKRRHSEPKAFIGNSAPCSPICTTSLMSSIPEPGHSIPRQSEVNAAFTVSPTSQQMLEDSNGFSTQIPGNTGQVHPLVGYTVPKPYTSSEGAPQSKLGSKAFITTLSRIQENIPAPEQGSASSLTSMKTSSTQSNTSLCTPTGSQTSLNSPGLRQLPLAWVGDNERIKQLQIVSKRAKKFENNVQEKESLAKSAFHKFELSRLSQRSKTPNVAQRREEFEKKDDLTSKASAGLNYELGTYFCGSTTTRQRSASKDKGWRLRRGSQEHPISPTSPPPNPVMRSFSDGDTMFPLPSDYLTFQTDDVSQPPATEGGNATWTTTGSRTAPIGGPRIHCEPPGARPLSDGDLLERELSNSSMPEVPGSTWWSCPQEGVTQGRHTLSNNSADLQQHSHLLNTLRSPLSLSPTVDGIPLVGVDTNITTSIATSQTTPTAVATPTPATTTVSTITALTAAGVARRSKPLYGDDGDRLVRRVSYLKATSGDRLYSDSDVDSDTEEQRLNAVGVSGATAAWRAVGALCVSDLPSPASLQSSVVKHGVLNVKLTKLEGKRAGDRSWKTVWAVVQGRALFFYKDKQHAVQTPLGAEDQLSLRGAEVGVASDYTKRRHVLRLSTPAGSQLLLQADTQPTMTAWLSALHHHSTAPAPPQEEFLGVSESGCKSSSSSCLTPPSVCLEVASTCTTTTTTTTTTPSLTTSSYNNNNNISGNSIIITAANNNVSPQTSSKALKKMTSSLRTRSPTGQSPSSKTRKATGAESGSSPKSKTWKGRFSRHLRKIHGGSTNTTTSAPLPEGAMIGVCLEDCPQSAENEFIPLLVSLCVGVVETRGLHTQGIYRIPGNKAAVTYLTELINRGPKAIDLSDPKWSDVNVISSLLKLFFQKLPDPLITSELYPQFIEASKTEDPTQRLIDIKQMVQELPDHHYETMRYLCFHLNRVVESSENNKMDVRNLAIVFGPTLVRAADDNMAKMVTDMSHQCRIVESLISQVHWVFSDDDSDDLPTPTPFPHSTVQSPLNDCQGLPSEAETPLAQALLLHNIPKMEGASKDSKKILVSSIINAANRKVQKVRPKRVGLEEEPSGLGVQECHGHDISTRGSSDVDLRRDYRVELPDPTPMSQRKISSMSLGSVQEQVLVNLPNTSSSAGELDGTSHRLDATSHSTSKDSTIFDPMVNNDEVPNMRYDITDNISPGSCTLPVSIPNAVTTVSPSFTPCFSHTLSDTSVLGDEVAIRSYAGLSASTQERIRRFEQETHAMLQRDVSRHRRESKRWEVDRLRVEEEWHRAKYDLETDDLLDQLADNPTEVVQKMSVHPWRNAGVVGGGKELPEGESEKKSSPNSEKQRQQEAASTITTTTTSSDAALISSALSRHFPLPNLYHPANTCATNAKPQATEHGSDRGLVRSGSLDSINDLAHQSQDDGSDLLSVITATFEEKMRSLQESPLTSSVADETNVISDGAVSCSSTQYASQCSNVGGNSNNNNNSRCNKNSKTSTKNKNSSNNREGNTCRLYRDPSLHRRRTSHSHITSTSLSSTNPSQIESTCDSEVSVGSTREVKVKRSDSLTKSEKTESNLKEKSEKRARELKRTETHEIIREKRPKEMKWSDTQESLISSENEDLQNKDPAQDTIHILKQSSEFRSRKHNVKELKEKFEQNNQVANNPSLLPKPSGHNCSKSSKSSSRRNKNAIKRRHTVGGTKDLAKLAWLQVLEASQRNEIINSIKNSSGDLNIQNLTAWEHLQPLIADQRLNTERSLEVWAARERMRTSSPDLSRLLALMLPANEREVLHRRLSVRESALTPLYPVLESNV